MGPSVNDPALAIGPLVHLSTGRLLRGGERQALLLHHGLTQRGCESHFLCRAGGACSRGEAKNLTPVAWHGELDLVGLARIVSRCSAIAPRLIHCHDAHALSQGSIVGAMLHVPVMYTRRVVFPMPRNVFSRLKYNRCAVIIAVSSAVARQCALVAPAEKIAVVHDGVDWNKPLLPRTDARAALGLTGECFVIGTAGYFTNEKNFRLIAALAEGLHKSRPGVRIVCIGPVGAQAACPDNTILTGYKPDAVSFYSAFDMYVSSSTREGLGSALLDAVVRDIPTVAVNAGGTSDIFPDGWPLIAPGDEAGFISAVVRTIDNLPAAQAAAAYCGLRARALFSVEAMVEKTIECYAAALKPQRA